MNTTKNSLIALLSLMLLVAAVLAWRQNRELASLRASLDRDQAELARAGQRAKSAEDRAAKLEKDAAQASARTAADKDAAAKHGEDPMSPARLRTMMASAADAMNRPEIQKAMALRQKAELDLNYAAMFRLLKLSPEKLDLLKKLMVERMQVGADVFAAAAQQGMDPMQNRRELAKLTAEGQSKVDTEIKSLLGDDDYSKYQNYQATLPQRSVVNQLQQSLSYTSNPLSESQAEQLVQILADNQPARPAGAPRENVAVTRTVVAGGPGGTATFVSPTLAVGSAPITDAAVDASRSVLNGAQVDALQQVQQQQAQLRSLMPTGPSAGGAVFQYRAVSSEAPPPPPLPTTPPTP